MATTKIFDIIIRSKHTPEGVRGALAGLKSIGEAGFFIRQGLIAPLMEGGRVLLDFIGAANPERVKELSDAFGQVKQAIGSLLDDVLGPTISELSRLIRQATLLTNASKNLEPVYADFFETMKRDGKDAADIVDEIGAASRRAVDQLAEGIRQNPLATIGVQAKDAAISTEQFRNIILASSHTLEEYLSLLKRAGIGYKDLADEIVRFNQSKGIEMTLPSADLMRGQQNLMEVARRAEKSITDIRTGAAMQRSRLLQDIAIREADRLTDLARRNAQQMADIESQRIAALRQAQVDLASQLANIDQESARSRIRIEEDYQERLRQIRQSSDQTIEEAIRRRDARALAAALNARKEQIDSATRDRDKTQRDNEESAAQQKEAARQQAEEQRRQAEDSARQALESMRRQNEETARESRIAQQRQLRDFNLSTVRRLQDAQVAGVKELQGAQANLRKIESAWKAHFTNVNRIIATETAENSKLFDAYRKYINDIFDRLLGRRLASPR